MHVEIVEENAAALVDYASVSNAYRSLEVLDLDSTAPADSALPYTAVAQREPFTKDYDALPGNHPLDWPSRFDVSSWGILSARIGARRVGGAIIVTPRSAREMVDGHHDAALLWDIRVAPMARSSGIGTALLGAAEAWANEHGAQRIMAETQNTNVPACRFYARSGYALGDVRRGAYAELPNEVQLLWFKDLV